MEKSTYKNLSFYNFTTSAWTELINEYIESERRSAPSLPGPPPPPAELLRQASRENRERLTHNLASSSQPRLVARGTGHQVSGSARHTCCSVFNLLWSAMFTEKTKQRNETKKKPHARIMSAIDNELQRGTHSGDQISVCTAHPRAMPWMSA